MWGGEQIILSTSQGNSCHRPKDIGWAEAETAGDVTSSPPISLPQSANQHLPHPLPSYSLQPCVSRSNPLPFHNSQIFEWKRPFTGPDPPPFPLLIPKNNKFPPSKPRSTKVMGRIKVKAGATREFLYTPDGVHAPKLWNTEVFHLRGGM